MLPGLDVDLLRSFIAIADTGSFTRAADEVHKTQGAVSMQMRKLEDLTGRPLFAREGRVNRLTQDGVKLLDYARRMVRLNDELMLGFTKPELSGTVRFGTPDDYADRILPEILARFARTHPQVRVDVECHNSTPLSQKVRHGEIDLAVITMCELGADEILRREPLVWVTSERHDVQHEPVLPLAVSSHGCAWRALTLAAIARAGRAHRIAYAAANSNAVIAAVQAGLAVGAMPEFLIRPGLRMLTEAEGFPPLGEFELGLIRAPGKAESGAAAALARHISDCLKREPHRALYAAE